MKKRLVKIEWVNPEDDWHYFYFLEVQGNLVRLQGADDLETGDKHDGEIFWAPIYEIAKMEEV